MSLTLSTIVGAVTKVPLVYTDDAGTVMPPVAGGTITSSDDAVLTVTLDETGGFVTVTAVAAGTGSVTYTNGALSAGLSVSIAAPVATKVDFDTPAATPVTA